MAVNYVVDYDLQWPWRNQKKCRRAERQPAFNRDQSPIAADEWPALDQQAPRLADTEGAGLTGVESIRARVLSGSQRRHGSPVQVRQVSPRARAQRRELSRLR